MAAAIQDVVTGYLIEGGADKAYDFTAAAIFWTAACILSFVLPVLNWRSMMKKVVEA